MTSRNIRAELGDPCRSSTAGLDVSPPMMKDNSVPPDSRRRRRDVGRMSEILEDGASTRCMSVDLELPWSGMLMPDRSKATAWGHGFTLSGRRAPARGAWSEGAGAAGRAGESERLWERWRA